MSIIVDQSTDWSNPLLGIGYDSDYYSAAIGWTAQETFAIDTLTVAMARLGSPTGTVHCEIWDDSGGSPNAIITNGTSNSIDVSTIHQIGGPQVAYSDHETVEFTWSTPPTLTSSSVYYFVIMPSWTADTSNCAGLARRGAVSTTNFTAWTGSTSDVFSEFTSAFWCQIRKAGNSPYPQNRGFGGMYAVNGATSVDVPYPRHISEDDLLFAVCIGEDTGAWNTATGWTIVDQYTDGSAYSAALYYKRATGSESGSQTFSGTDSCLRGGKIYHFDSCADTGTPYEDATEAYGTGSPVTISSITTTDDNELGVCFMAIEDNVTVTANAGTVEWDEAAEGCDAEGTDLGTAIYKYKIASATTTTARSCLLWGNDNWASWTLALLPRAWTIDLTINEATHSHSAESPGVYATYALSVNDCAHAHAADAPAVYATYVLSVNDALHGHTADQVPVEAMYVLAIAEATHAHAADEPAISVINHLSIDEAAHSHLADEPTITALFGLSIAECAHAHTADQVAIAIEYDLDVAGASHAHTADEPTITALYPLTLDDCAHAHSAESPAVIALFDLTPDDCLHSHAADQVGVVPTYHLAIAEAIHAHAAESPAVEGIYTLAVDECSHAHSAEACDYTIDYFLVIADGQHAHTADQLTITYLTDLTVNEASHAHAAEEPSILLAHSLDVAEASHAHTAEEPSIVRVHVLSVAEADHAHTADEPAIQSLVDLAPADCFHGHTADQLELVLGNSLDIAECSHGHTADELTLQASLVLVINDATHAVASEEPDLWIDYYLVINDALHGHVAESLTLTRITGLSVEDSTHGHVAEEPSIAAVLTLDVAEATHGHAAEEPTIQSINILTINDAAHAVTSDELAIEYFATLTINDCFHNHLADPCNVEKVIQVGDLEIDDCHHTHAAEEMTITYVHNLTVNEALHAQAAEEVALTRDARNQVYPGIMNRAANTTADEMALLNLTSFFGGTPATGVWTNPSETDTATMRDDAFVRITDITLPSSGVITIDIRKTGSDELTLEIDSTGRLRLLENGVARITGSAGDVSNNSEATVIVDGVDAELYGDGTQVGTYGSLGITTGTGAELTSLGTGGALAKVEFMPRRFPLLPHEL